MKLRSPGALPYVVTSDDVLWLLRAVAAEGPDERQVAQTLLNGFLWARATGRWSHSLGAWVRAYAQPVNPRWYPEGDLHQREVERLQRVQPDKVAHELAKAERRERVHATRDTFSDDVRAAVARAFTGPRDIPPNATDYAAHTLDATRKGYRPLSPPVPGRNRLWARPGAFSWPGFTSNAVNADSVWPWAAAVALGAAVAWKASKGGKRG